MAAEPRNYVAYQRALSLARSSALLGRLRLPSRIQPTKDAAAALTPEVPELQSVHSPVLAPSASPTLESSTLAAAPVIEPVEPVAPPAAVPAAAPAAVTAAAPAAMTAATPAAELAVPPTAAPAATPAAAPAATPAAPAAPSTSVSLPVQAALTEPGEDPEPASPRDSLRRASLDQRTWNPQALTEQDLEQDSATLIQAQIRRRTAAARMESARRSWRSIIQIQSCWRTHRAQVFRRLVDDVLAYHRLMCDRAGIQTRPKPQCASRGCDG
jgi:hypothetical protein